MKFITLIVLGLVSTAASAVNFHAALNQEISRLQELRSSTSTDRNVDPSCKRQYANLYNKKLIKTSFGFGYGDSENSDVVWDNFTYLAFKRRLLMPCPHGVTLCGFRADGRDPDLLRKIAFAPTDENNYMIELRLTRGSIGGNHTQNMSTPQLAKQMAHCAMATNKFMKEVADGADVVIYNGHSRNGGGPDFCPGIRLANNHVNYPYYQSRRPGITALTKAMSEAKKKGVANKVVGMFSCSSQLHFYKPMMAVNNKAGYILTSRIANFLEMQLDSFAALDGILAQRCNDGFEESFGHRRATLWKNMFSGN